MSATSIRVGDHVVTLPPKFTGFRPHQDEAIRRIARHFLVGHHKFVMLDAPTGAGKTVIGEATRQILTGASDKGLYLCTTKTLQEQFLHDFPDAKLIKGRANYPTLDRPDLFDAKGGRRLHAGMCVKQRTNGPLCDGCDIGNWDLDCDPDDYSKTTTHCLNCHPWQFCPYEQAKRAALRGPLTVANTAYFITEATHVGMLGADDDTGVPHFKVAIIDEADTLESVLMSQVSLNVSARRIKEYGWGLPERKTVSSSWIDWLANAERLARARARESETAFSNASGDAAPILKERMEEDQRVHSQVESVLQRVSDDPDGWVFDGYQDGNAEFKPITVAPYAGEAMWRHFDKVLLMSATLISDVQMANDLGIPDHALVEVDSKFPKERRPIYVRPRAKMSHKTKDVDYPKMADALRVIMDTHPTERILVHTHSYELTRYLAREVRNVRTLHYENARERETVLQRYVDTPGSVLLAPSMDRGVDLPDDLARVVVITKIPFPHLGDKQVSGRLYGTGPEGRQWYATQTIRSLVQMTGRGMRHADDYCISYILDAQFMANVWRNSRHLIPAWWREALVWEVPGQ